MRLAYRASVDYGACALAQYVAPCVERDYYQYLTSGEPYLLAHESITRGVGRSSPWKSCRAHFDQGERYRHDVIISDKPNHFRRWHSCATNARCEIKQKKSFCEMSRAHDVRHFARPSYSTRPRQKAASASSYQPISLNSRAPHIDSAPSRGRRCR